MPKRPRSPSILQSHPWPLVLCLVGVDYFSTLAYLPSMAVEAAGPFAPIAAFGVVLATFLLAMPTYWYLVGRAPEGRGTAGVLETLIPGWRGKFAVLTLLGFAAADFVITRSLSLADAAIHLIHNPHGTRLLESLPAHDLAGDAGPWSPLARLIHRVLDPQVAITILLAVASFALWQFLKRGVTRKILYFAAAAVTCYLTLTAIVIVGGLIHACQRPEIWREWSDAIFLASDPAAPAERHWLLAWLGIALWTFPQLALGLSGFEMIMTVVPNVSGAHGGGADALSVRVRNTRKLMMVGAAVMAAYMLSAVLVTTLLVPREAILPNGAAEHRALAYLAHGSHFAMNPLNETASPFGHGFGDLYDIATATLLCLAGASVTLGLQNLLPHYLNRLGMELSWAGRVGVILNVLNVIVLVVTVVFRASPASQQWAYATSVLMLLAGAAFAAALDMARRTAKRGMSWLGIVAGGFFVTMTCFTVSVNHAGLTIALLFVSAIIVTSFISRWIRSTELRLEGFEFADAFTERRWSEFGNAETKILAPHRPGLSSLTEKCRELYQAYRIDPATLVLFIEARVDDPSNFYQRPLLRIEREGDLEVIRVSRCVSVSHVLAAICLELCREGTSPPQIIFGWSHESPLAANLNFLLLGEGNIPWMVKELLRKAMPDAARQPKVRIG